MPLKTLYTTRRRESRMPMEVPVVLDGHRHLPGSESTFTENVSSRGARVLSIRSWERNARVSFATRSGEFRSEARVAYCQSIRGGGYAVGLEFLEPQGRWVVVESEH